MRIGFQNQRLSGRSRRDGDATRNGKGPCENTVFHESAVVPDGVSVLRRVVESSWHPSVAVIAESPITRLWSASSLEPVRGGDRCSHVAPWRTNAKR